MNVFISFFISKQEKKTREKAELNKTLVSSGYMSSPDFQNLAVLHRETIDLCCSCDYDSPHWDIHGDQQGQSSKHIFAWMNLLTSKAKQLERPSLTLCLEK